MSIPRELMCPDCENLLDIEIHPKPNTFIGLCPNNKCKKAWFITKDNNNSTLKFQLAKKYEESPRGKDLQHQLGLDSLIILFQNSDEPAHVYYDPNLSKFIIYYRSDNDLIHELGHLIIDSKPEHYKVEKPWEEEKRDHIDNIINAIIDIIVDYNLVMTYKMGKFYDDTALESKVADKIIKIVNENKKMGEKFQLADYCYIYLKLNFYLKDEDKLKVSKRMKTSLKKIRQRSLYKLKMSSEKFKDIEDKLSKIKNIKNFNDMKEICEYFHSILAEINLWNKNVILNKLKKQFL